MWDELGIAPCADPKAIRRAYAARLKKLDPDRDPNGFARLRDAYEWALKRAGADEPRSSQAPPASADGDANAVEDDLHTAARPQAEAEQELGEPASAHPATDRTQAPGLQPPLPASEHDDIRDQALLAALDAALRRGDANAATGLYYRAAATGALSLESAPDVTERLLAVAVDDMTLAAAAFRDLVRIAGADKPRSRAQAASQSELHRRVLARLRAEDWYDDLLVKAKQRKGRAARRQAKIARLILGQIGRHRQPRVDKIALRSTIEPYKIHAVWLQDRIDPAWMAVVDRRLRARELFWTTLFTLFIGALLVQFVIGVIVAIMDGGQPLWLILTGPFFAVFLLWLLKLLTDQLLKAWIPGWTGYGVRARLRRWGARMRAIRGRSKPKADEDAG
jgi:hypothetical protein